MASCPVLRIERHLTADVLDVMDLEDTPLVTQPTCFCCGGTMRVRVILGSDSGRRIRLGTCPGCGYVGYMDRPTEEWLKNFYDSRWDRKVAKTIADIRPFSPNAVVPLVRELRIPVDASIFEIGTGYGQILKQLQEAGYVNLSGLEHAPQRAALAAAYTGAKVFHGVFGSPEATAAARERAPYALMYSKSVMEHMYDPRLLFRSASALQQPGGYLLTAVPDVWEEPTPLTLLFLPHIHGFTDRALTLLAARHGYATERIVRKGTGLIHVARKVGDAALPEETLALPAVHGDIAERWQEELRFDALHGRRGAILWWSVKDRRHTGVLPWFAPGALGRFLEPFVRVALGSRVLLPPRRLLLGIPRRSGSFVASLHDGTAAEGEAFRIEGPHLTLLYK